MKVGAEVCRIAPKFTLAGRAGDVDAPARRELPMSGDMFQFVIARSCATFRRVEGVSFG